MIFCLVSKFLRWECGVNGNNYSILFEPVKIGPLTAGTGSFKCRIATAWALRPQADAATRAIKAEGGWAVVYNQETGCSSDLHHFQRAGSG